MPKGVRKGRLKKLKYGNGFCRANVKPEPRGRTTEAHKSMPEIEGSASLKFFNFRALGFLGFRVQGLRALWFQGLGFYIGVWSLGL